MKIARQILGELFQVFVDDGRLAVLLVLWSGAVWISTSMFADAAGTGGILLVIGSVGILLENVWRFGHQRRREEKNDNG